MRYKAILKLKNRIKRGGAKKGEAWMCTPGRGLAAGGYAVVLWLWSQRRSRAIVAMLRQGMGLTPRRRLFLPGPGYLWSARLAPLPVEGETRYQGGK